MTIRYTPPTMKAYPREALDRFFKSLNRFPRISTEHIMAKDIAVKIPKIQTNLE